MSTKSPTLNSYTETSVDVTKFPRAYEDASDEFYETLYSECERLSTALTENLPCEANSNGYIVDFDKARFTHYENAIAADPEVVLQGLVPACHMTERIVREHLGIDGLYGYCDDEAQIRGEGDIQAFISYGCLEFLSGKKPLETILLLYFRSQESNRVQHDRGAFYKDVHKRLKKDGFEVKRDDSLPGRPNLVINKEQPIEFTDNAIVGKAVRASSNDVPKRARQAGTCCGELSKEPKNPTKVVVFEITGDEFPNNRVRESQREKIMSQNPEEIDKVFFHDELDEFIEFCDDRINVFGEVKDQPGARDETHASLDAW